MPESQPERIAQFLESMQSTGTVNRLIIDRLNEMIELVRSLEKSSLSKGPSATNNFVLYHAARNSILFLSKARERFVESQPKNDNPKVVDDSLDVWPSFVTLYNSMLYAEKRIISSEMRSFILERVEDLRTSAIKANMFPKFDEEKKGLDSEKIKEGITEIAGSIRELIGS